MNFFNKLSAKIKADYMGNVSDQIQQLVAAGKTISQKQFDGLQMNSYEAKLVYPLLDHEAYISLVRRCLTNCSQRPLSKYQVGSTYDEALLGYLVEGLCQRLERDIKG